MISEEMLCQGAKEAAKAYLASLPEPEACHHTFSPAFERKMKRLLRREKHKALYRGLHRVAGFVLVLFLCGSVFLSTNAQARGLFFGWGNEVVGTVSSYIFEGSSDNNPERYRYTLPEIPEGYQKEDFYEENGVRNELYINERGDYFGFDYFYTTESSTTELDILNVNEMERKEVAVNGTVADFYFDDTGKNSSALVWNDPETDVLLCLNGYFSEDELIQLAESVIREEE